MNGMKALRAAQWAALLVVGWSVPVVIGVSGHFVGMSMDGTGMPTSHLVGHSIATWWPWIPITPLAFLAWRKLPRRGPGLALTPVAHLGIVTLAYVTQVWLSVAIGHRTGHVPPELGFDKLVVRAISDLALYDILIYAGVLATIASLDFARRYRDRDLLASQLEAQLAQARLSALQMQLQPHFLFNALNSVAMLVRRQQTREALDVIVGFSELLRYVLDEAGTTDVPLRVELRFVRQYLEIEKVRYGDRLVIVVDAAPELDEAVVPNLVLQPLVENAIKHGIATRASGGTVTVSATRRGDELVLAVRNDGPALPAGWTVEESDGVGLRNVRERLEASVGTSARLEIFNVVGGAGVEATITLPFRLMAARATAPAQGAAVARAG